MIPIAEARVTKVLTPAGWEEVRDGTLSIEYDLTGAPSKVRWIEPGTGQRVTLKWAAVLGWKETAL